MEYLNGPFPVFLKAMAGRLSHGKRFLTGDKLCTGDFLFGAIILNVVYNEMRPKIGEID